MKNSFLLCPRNRFHIILLINTIYYRTGHSVVHLYNDNLKQVSINIPSIQGQKRISDTLELLDKKIEL